MEVINYFKFKSLICIYVSDKLRDLFKYRFQQVSCSQWKDNAAHGSVLLKQFSDSQIQELFTGGRQLIKIQKGVIEKYSFTILVKVLTNTTSAAFNNEILEQQNQIINSINKLYLDNIKVNYTLKLSNEIYTKLKDQVYQYVKELLKTIKQDIRNDQDEINYLLDTLQIDQEKNIINKDNELKADGIKQSGTKLYSNQNYFQAFNTFYQALDLNRLSSYTKSILMLNASTSKFEEHKQLTINMRLNSSYLIENDDYKQLDTSKVFAFKSLTQRPHWSKAYFRLGLILSKLSKYQLAIESFEASLILDNSDTNIQLVTPCLDQTKSKLHHIQTNSNPDGTRNFEKETQSYLDQTGNNVIKKTFYPLPSTDQLIVNKVLPSIKLFLVALVKSGIPKQLALETYLINKAVEKISYTGIPSSQQPLPVPPERCIEILGHLIGKDTQCAKPYLFLANGSIVTQDKLALVSKATTLPIPWYTTPSYGTNELSRANSCNYDVVLATEALGIISRHGMWDHDIDFEKAEYYFKLSIERDQSINLSNGLRVEEGFTGLSYLALGDIYYNGRLNNNIKTKVLEDRALNIWRSGTRIKDSKYYNYISQKKNQESRFDDSNPNSSPAVGIKYDKIQMFQDNELSDNSLDGDMIAKEYYKQDSNLYLHPVDLHQVKQSTNDSEYSENIFYIYSTVSNFITSFEAYKKNNTQLSNKGHIQLIKPIADLYCQHFMYEFIRLPVDILNELVTLSISLYQLNPNDPICAVFYLGIHRFTDTDYNELYNIADKFTSSITGKRFENKYIETIATYKIVYAFYTSRLGTAFKSLIKFEKFTNCSTPFFNYHLLCIVMRIKDSSKYIKGKNNEELVTLFERSQTLFNKIDDSNTLLPNYAVAMGCTLAATKFKQRFPGHPIYTYFKYAMESLNEIPEHLFTIHRYYATRMFEYFKMIVVQYQYMK